MKVAVSGSRGLIGSAFIAALGAEHQVIRIVRPETSADEAGTVLWDPAAGSIDASRLERVDVVVHLAGESIASGRWTRSRKAAIRESRVKGTRLLCEALARLSPPPAVVVAASAMGYYGDRGDEVLTEKSGPGTGFLADVCRDWEAATAPAAGAGIRVVNLRTGIVLSRRGGALAKMLPPFRLGLGGPMGSGRQYMSWIALDDMAGVIGRVLETPRLSGPVNAASPRPVTNAEFSRILGRVLSRPAFFPLPAVAARLMLGEMADALLLSSARLEPEKLRSSGFDFRHPDLEEALRSVLGG